MTVISVIPALATGQVIKNSKVATGHFTLEISLPITFPAPVPGQFVMIRDPERNDPLLPRPISVYGFRREEDHFILELLCRIAGKSTTLFSRLQPGSCISVLGPLGRGFTIDTDIREIIMVAGGVGVAPLAYILKEGSLLRASSGERRVTAYLGAGTAELLAGLNCFQNFCELRTATDDGSCGYHGNVTDMLAPDLELYNAKETLVLACGPGPMIRSLALLLRDREIRCQVSLEERMACGVGACLGCVVAIRDGEGEISYRRVCKEGPVFDIRTVLFEDAME